MRQSSKDYKRIVIKIGSSLLYKNKKLDYSILKAISRQIVPLVKKGKEVVLVSSGAIALGMHILGLKERPRELSHLQAVAAIGQNELMNAYRNFFNKNNFVAQILLTWEDFNSRKRYLNAQNTLNGLMDYRKYGLTGIIPVINENDTVSTEEIKFGDNDKLSALVANLINADFLIILSDVDGLMDKNKKTVRVVSEFTAQVKELASPTDKKTSVGGMVTKLEAAKIAVDSGIACLLANGRRRDIIFSALKAPQSSGTLFLPKRAYFELKKRWIAFGTRPKAGIIVDQGAKKALLNKKSLLCVGVIGVKGVFETGDIVNIIDNQGCEFARGKARISSNALDKVKGSRQAKEVIHCDNIAILNNV
ncbi:MAG: glutamate 5-kinase [Candidatus Omnitrophota bacterium]|nr:MAG: glutamate 5-kinase [Candidatus Omnitrophota bacterium]